MDRILKLNCFEIWRGKRMMHVYPIQIRVTNFQMHLKIFSAIPKTELLHGAISCYHVHILEIVQKENKNHTTESTSLVPAVLLPIYQANPFHALSVSFSVSFFPFRVWCIWIHYSITKAKLNKIHFFFEDSKI